MSFVFGFMTIGKMTGKSDLTVSTYYELMICTEHNLNNIVRRRRYIGFRLHNEKKRKLERHKTYECKVLHTE